MRRRVETQENLWIFQQAAHDLIVENNAVAGVVTQTGIRFRSKCVATVAGTFLNGLVHIGLSTILLDVLEILLLFVLLSV